MSKLSNNERSPFTDVIVLSVADLAAIVASGGTKTIAKIPVGGAIELVSICTIDTFGVVGTAIPANGNVSVGISGATGLYLAAAVPPATSTTIPRFNTGTGYTPGTANNATGLLQPISQATADTNVLLTVLAGSSTGAYSALTTGKIAIGIRILDLYNLGANA